MCWCMKLSCTIVSNLFNRMCNGFMDLYYTCCSNVEAEDQYECASLKDNNLDLEKIRGYKENLPEPIRNPIENQPYFKAVDRLSGEQILLNRVDGSCLIRPYKEQDTCIKYIASIYAKNNYFHLFIRKTEHEKYALGLEKPREKYFNSPIDIINYYRLNKLQCTNSFISAYIVLVPIT